MSTLMDFGRYKVNFTLYIEGGFLVLKLLHQRTGEVYLLTMTERPNALIQAAEAAMQNSWNGQTVSFPFSNNNFTNGEFSYRHAGNVYMIVLTFPGGFNGVDADFVFRQTELQILINHINKFFSEQDEQDLEFELAIREYLIVTWDCCEAARKAMTAGRLSSVYVKDLYDRRLRLAQMVYGKDDYQFATIMCDSIILQLREDFDRGHVREEDLSDVEFASVWISEKKEHDV